MGDFGQLPSAHSRQHVAQILRRRDMQPTTDSITDKMAATLGPDCALPTWSQFLRPKAIGRMQFSARLFDNLTVSV